MKIQMGKIDEILTRLDSSEAINRLAEEVKLRAELTELIKELDQKLKQVETEVRDVFQDLDESDPD